MITSSSRASNNSLNLITAGLYKNVCPTIRVSELIKENELGKLKYIALTRINLGRIKHNTNVLWDLAPHDFSIVLDWLGKLPKKIQKALENKLRLLMSNSPIREKIGKAAMNDTNKFKIENISLQWEQLINNLLN